MILDADDGCSCSSWWWCWSRDDSSSSSYSSPDNVLRTRSSLGASSSSGLIKSYSSPGPVAPVVVKKKSRFNFQSVLSNDERQGFDEPPLDLIFGDQATGGNNNVPSRRTVISRQTNVFHQRNNPSPFSRRVSLLRQHWTSWLSSACKQCLKSVKKYQKNEDVVSYFEMYLVIRIGSHPLN